MAIGSKDLASTELRGLDDERLVDELRKAKEELFNLRFQSATGQLDNHGRLRAVRKDIARIYTEMRERELGIGVKGEDRVKHALYGKVIRRTSKVKAHDEANTAGVGDRVLIMETRPLSATKRWRLVEILEKAK